MSIFLVTNFLIFLLYHAIIYLLLLLYWQQEGGVQDRIHNLFTDLYRGRCYQLFHLQMAGQRTLAASPKMNPRRAATLRGFASCPGHITSLLAVYYIKTACPICQIELYKPKTLPQETAFLEGASIATGYPVTACWGASPNPFLSTCEGFRICTFSQNSNFWKK